MFCISLGNARMGGFGVRMERQGQGKMGDKSVRNGEMGKWGCTILFFHFGCIEALTSNIYLIGPSRMQKDFTAVEEKEHGHPIPPSEKELATPDTHVFHGVEF